MGKVSTPENGRKMLADLDLVRIARDAAARAVAYIRSTGRPATPAGWTEKGRHDFVSTVDRGAEELIRGTLERAVDPIDGTTNFLHGYPAYAVSIAAAVDGALRAGVVVHVPDGRVFHAARGHGAYCDDRPIHVSSITEPGHALIGTGFPFKELRGMDRYVEQFKRVAAATAGIRRPGSAALDLCSVACGEYDAFWELSLSAWDIAAGTLIVREAGGRVTDDRGRDIGIEHGPVVAGNAAMHEWMMAIVRRKS